ncbi:hypothetical protein PI125_g3242 [Phytophthora idaei]|nr:hypothetical protein PI125_g3242 [Phytophthora idaei]
MESIRRVSACVIAVNEQRGEGNTRQTLTFKGSTELTFLSGAERGTTFVYTSTCSSSTACLTQVNHFPQFHT